MHIGNAPPVDAAAGSVGARGVGSELRSRAHCRACCGWHTVIAGKGVGARIAIGFAAYMCERSFANPLRFIKLGRYVRRLVRAPRAGSRYCNHMFCYRTRWVDQHPDPGAGLAPPGAVCLSSLVWLVARSKEALNH